MFDPEDYDDEADLLEKRDRLIEKRFIEGCNEAYDMIVRSDIDVILESNHEKTREALNKMLWYFIGQEEFEKCSTIKNFYLRLFGELPNPTSPPLPLNFRSNVL